MTIYWTSDDCDGQVILTLHFSVGQVILFPYFDHCFSVLCELLVELVLFQIALNSVRPPQSGPSSRSLPSHLHHCYLLCNVRVFSSHHMAIPRKAFLGDICGDWLDHCIATELFISDLVFPCFALNPS